MISSTEGSGRLIPTSNSRLFGKKEKAATRRRFLLGTKDDGKDEGTSSAAANYRKYGDLIVWRQIMDRATEAKKGVIFINDDKKEDWWLIFRGKTLGPRPELIEEFLNKTGQGFYMYQADRFLEYAAEHLKQEITPESMDEIRDLRKRDLDLHDELLRRQEEEMKFRENELRDKVREALERLENSRTRMAYLREKTIRLQDGQAVYREKLDRSGGEDHESLEKFLELRDKAASAEREIAQAQEEMKSMENEYVMARQMFVELQTITEQRLARGRGLSPRR